MKMYVPEADELFQKVKTRITKEMTVAWVAAFIFGLLAHLYMFVGKFPTRDELVCVFSSNDMSILGRWLLKYASIFSADTSVGWVVGILSIAAIGIAAALIVSLFDIKKKWEIVAISAALVTFPTVANTFTYMYTADAYFISVVLAVLAVYVTDRRKYGFLIGTLLLVVSLAIYQAYIGLSVALMAMLMLRMLLKKQYTDKQIWIKIGQFAITLVAGVVAYILLTKLVSNWRGIALNAYQGIAEMGQIDFVTLPEQIVNAYYEFAQFFLRSTMLVAGRYMRYVHMIIGAAEIGLILWTLFRTPKKSIFQTLLTLFVVITIPLTFGVVFLMGASHVNWIMRYAYVCVYLLLIVSYECFAASCQEKQLKRGKWAKNALSLVAAALLAVTSWAWVVRSNEAYFCLELEYESCYALANRVIYSVEQNDAFSKETPVAVCGAFANGNYPATKPIVFRQFSHMIDQMTETDYVLIWKDRYFDLFTSIYLGRHFVLAEEADVQAIEASAEYAAMPCYPEQGSIKLIDGILIVKAGN